MNYEKYGLGCFKDKVDERDFIYEPSGAVKENEYPTEFILEKFPVKNQGKVQSCVAHSLALMKEIQEFYQSGKRLTFSVGWIYGLRLINQYQGEGMYPREALSNLLKYGDVLLSDFPENLEINEIGELIKKRKAKCIESGKKYKIKSYAKTKNLTAVKSALFEKHSPVIISVSIYDNFYKIGKDGIVPNKKGNYRGSHAMTIIGWKKIKGCDYYIIQNSWGEKWGNNGCCYIKPSNNIIEELYTVVDMV